MRHIVAFYCERALGYIGDFGLLMVRKVFELCSFLMILHRPCLLRPLVAHLGDSGGFLPQPCHEDCASLSRHSRSSSIVMKTRLPMRVTLGTFAFFDQLANILI